MTTETPERFREEISTITAAEKYQLTPSYVARLARTHIIRARKFGRDWIIDEEALRHYLAQPRKPGPKPRTATAKEDMESVEMSTASQGGETGQHATAKGHRLHESLSQ